MTKKEIIGNVAFVIGLLMVAAAIYSGCPPLALGFLGLIVALFGYSLSKYGSRE